MNDTLSMLSSRPVPRRRWLWITLVVLVLLLPAACIGLWPVNRPTEVTVKRSFLLDKEYYQTVIALTPEEALRQIVVLGNSEYLGKEGGDEGPLGLGLGGPRNVLTRLLADQPLQRKSVMLVRTHDDYVGVQDIRLSQVADIEPDEIRSDTNLLEPEGRLLGYHCQTHIYGEGEQTRVDAELTMTIETYAPSLFRWVARQRVQAAAEERLELLENAFRKVTHGEAALPTTDKEAALPPMAAKLVALADWRKRLVRS